MKEKKKEESRRKMEKVEEEERSQEKVPEGAQDRWELSTKISSSRASTYSIKLKVSINLGFFSISLGLLSINLS